MSPRNTSKMACLILAGALGPAAAFAHILWIETDPRGEPGKPHDVRCYFGEPQECLREEKGGRLDEMMGIRAQVTNGAGKTSELPLKEEQNCFRAKAEMPPPGLCSVTASQAEHEVQDLTQYGLGVVLPRFYARAMLLSFEPGRVSERLGEIPAPQDLDILPVTRNLDPRGGSIDPKAGQEVAVRVVFQGKPLAGAKLSVNAPNGWQKEIKTDASGVAAFQPLWDGPYVLQVEQKEKTPGTFKGKPYEAIRHLATLSLRVASGKEDAAK